MQKKIQGELKTMVDTKAFIGKSKKTREEEEGSETEKWHSKQTIST